MTTMDRMKQLFLHAPFFVKRAMADVEALRLRRTRKNAMYHVFFKDIDFQGMMESGDFPQEKLLVDLLIYALAYVPAYKGKPYRTLADFPLLSKLELRERYTDFLSTEINQKQCVSGKTSGSTGTPLTYYMDPELVAYNYACTDHHVAYIGGRLGDRKIRISGKAIVPPDTQKPPFWLYIRPNHQLQFSAYHIEKQTASAYCHAMRRFAGEGLANKRFGNGTAYGTGYARAWLRLAELFQAERLTPPRLQVIRLDSEGIELRQQALVQSVFGCNVVQTYGLSEIGQFGIQCANGHYHIIPGFAYVEVVPLKDAEREADGTGCAGDSGCEGEIVVTTLRGKRAPLIRYRTGDVGVLGKGDCGCGMHTQYLTKLVGRIDDYILVGGKKVDRLSHLLKVDKGVIASQIVQTDAKTLVFRIIPDENYTPDVLAQIQRNAKPYIEKGMQLRFELVHALEKTQNGKARYVLRKYNPSDEVGVGS